MAVSQPFTRAVIGADACLHALACACRTAGGRGSSMAMMMAMGAGLGAKRQEVAEADVAKVGLLLRAFVEVSGMDGQVLVRYLDSAGSP